jgi:hypothetical protein
VVNNTRFPVNKDIFLTRLRTAGQLPRPRPDEDPAAGAGAQALGSGHGER